MLGTNPRFKKPRAIGEKVDSFGMGLEVRSPETHTLRGSAGSFALFPPPDYRQPIADSKGKDRFYRTGEPFSSRP